MRYTFMIIILAVFAPSAVMAGHGKLPRKIMRDSLEVITRRCAEVLDGAYMTQKYLGTNRRVEGWEGYPVKLYEYYTGYDSTACGPKKGKVYLPVSYSLPEESLPYKLPLALFRIFRSLPEGCLS